MTLADVKNNIARITDENGGYASYQDIIDVIDKYSDSNPTTPPVAFVTLAKQKLRDTLCNDWDDYLITDDHMRIYSYEEEDGVKRITLIFDQDYDTHYEFIYDMNNRFLMSRCTTTKWVTHHDFDYEDTRYRGY